MSNEAASSFESTAAQRSVLFHGSAASVAGRRGAKSNKKFRLNHGQIKMFIRVITRPSIVLFQVNSAPFGADAFRFAISPACGLQ